MIPFDAMEITATDLLPIRKFVPRRSGDHKNPFPAFGLRPRPDVEIIDLMMVMPDNRGRPRFIASRAALAKIRKIGGFTPSAVYAPEP